MTLRLALPTIDVFVRPFRPTLLNQLRLEVSLDARLRPKEKDQQTAMVQENRGRNCRGRVVDHLYLRVVFYPSQTQESSLVLWIEFIRHQRLEGSA
jgi:hypothetical protein